MIKPKDYLQAERASLLDLRERRPRGSVLNFESIWVQTSQDSQGLSHLSKGCIKSVESELLTPLEIFFEKGCEACLSATTVLPLVRVVSDDVSEGVKASGPTITIAEANIDIVLSELLELDGKVRRAQALSPKGAIETFKDLTSLEADFSSSNLLGFYLGPEEVLNWLPLFRQEISKKSDELLQILLNGNLGELERFYAARLPDQKRGSDFFLVDFTRVRFAEVRALVKIYGLKLEQKGDLTHIPGVILRGLERRGLGLGEVPKVEVGETLEPSAIEALGVLYAPEGGSQGVYHLLDQAYWAACEL